MPDQPSFSHHRRHLQKIILLIILILSLLLASAAAATGGPELVRWVTGGGGGRLSVGNITLDNTLGQWVVGTTTQDGSQLDHGFWFTSARNTTFIPLALNNR